MEINLLLRLVIAHLLTDFVLQPKSWVTDREQKKGKSSKLYIHVIITTIVAYLFSGLYDNLVIPLVIFSTHLFIDYIKSKTNKDKFSYFIADQLAHLLVIVILWLSIENIWVNILPFKAQLFSNTKFWVVSAGYLFVSWPLGIIIGKATQKWRDQISREKEKLTLNKSDDITEENQTPALPEITKTTEEQELGLASAGKWIGICERILILTFVLMAQYTAIGFLMTAKSILRFSEKEANTQLKTEYVLVGTLVSFASSAMIGVLINLLLK
ncbi:DUF3307 domain-containing protein [Pedobacter frigoris]|uniref:DUF3307 domain-containing protein n=1 Tax=Pedobacter frigoris TaxID=2571272 RepID=UPI00292F7012|nr:DUF3307 domain-containing protein [Pedobacter frigoris]